MARTRAVRIVLWVAAIVGVGCIGLFLIGTGAGSALTQLFGKSDSIVEGGHAVADRSSASATAASQPGTLVPVANVAPSRISRNENVVSGTIPMPNKFLDPTPLRGKVVIGSLDDLPEAFRAAAARDLEDMKTKGFVTVDDSALNAFRYYQNKILPLDVVQKNINMPLTDIASTAFRTLRYEGTVPEGPNPEGPWTSVTHVFANKDGALVMLYEWAYVIDGGGGVMQKELINEQIGGNPAVFTIKRTTSGAGATEVAWYTGDKFYLLTASKELHQPEQRAWLVGLANSLPSTPIASDNASVTTPAVPSTGSPDLK